MRVIFYLTVGEQPSGVYRSQVIDVVHFLSESFPIDIRLVAFISGRRFFVNRRKIKRELPRAIVLPMFPKLRNWRKSSVLLRLCCVFLRPKRIISRGAIATSLAIEMRNIKVVDTVIYDGRGAMTAELEEYILIKDTKTIEAIKGIESVAVLESDMRIAVSSMLVKYWIEEFDFSGRNCVVIPCTLYSRSPRPDLSCFHSTLLKVEFGIDEKSVVLAYSGSSAGWQSFSLLTSYLESIMMNQLNVVVLFLAPLNDDISFLIKKYSGRVFQKFVDAEEVRDYLATCDYGLLLRESSKTNHVSSPVKFAEYLSCGLNVIISRGIGDYSDLANLYPFVIVQDQDIVFRKISTHEKRSIMEFAFDKFSKSSYSLEYRTVVGV